jgi:hypothetical protein
MLGFGMMEIVPGIEDSRISFESGPVFGVYLAESSAA